MYECFNCGSRSVIWDNDHDFEEFGLEGEGIVHALHCEECGAKIYYVMAERTEADNAEK